MVWASGQAASWTPYRSYILGMSAWEEALGQMQDSLKEITSLDGLGNDLVSHRRGWKVREVWTAVPMTCTRKSGGIDLWMDVYRIKGNKNLYF